MTTYKIPIDSLVYRVGCRLGILDPNVDKYWGENSPADMKIQTFVSKVLPNKPWLLDEPLWSTGRQPNKGGHCYPTHTNCGGCLFESVCRKKLLDTDPSFLGMQLPHTQPRPLPNKEAISKGQEEYRKFVELLNKLRSENKITPEQRRDFDKQWRENPQKRPWLIQHLENLQKEKLS
jgi:hypothetical protein